MVTYTSKVLGLKFTARDWNTLARQLLQVHAYIATGNASAVSA